MTRRQKTQLQNQSFQPALDEGADMKVDFSNFRFVRYAHANKVPVAALNYGITCAVGLFTFKIEEAADRLDFIIAR